MPNRDKTTHGFDSVGYKHQVQKSAFKRIEGLTPREEILYFDRRAREGPFSELWQRLERSGQKARLKGRLKGRSPSRAER